VFGPGHIITSAALAALMLEREMAALEVRISNAEVRRPGSALEPLDPKNRLVRVNLRPLAAARCKAQGARRNVRDVDWLAEALVESARKVKGDPELMQRRLVSAVKWCQQHLPEQAAELERLATRAGESGYPAFHHSSAYQRAYRPAYRVVLRSCLKRSRASGRAG